MDGMYALDHDLVPKGQREALDPRPSDRSSLRAEVWSRMVQRFFYCSTGCFCIFPFHAVPNPIGEVNNKTCRTVSIMKCAMVGCQH